MFILSAFIIVFTQMKTTYEGCTNHCATSLFNKNICGRIRLGNIPRERTSLFLTYRLIFLFTSFHDFKPLFKHLGYFLVAFFAVFEDESSSMHVLKDMLTIVIPTTIIHDKITFRSSNQSFSMPKLLPKILVFLFQSNAFFLKKRQFRQHYVLFNIYFFYLKQIIV